MKADRSDNKSSLSLEQDVKGVLILQFGAAVIMLVCIAIYVLISGNNWPLLLANFKASVYGSMLAIIGSILSARSVRRSSPLDGEKAVPGQAPVSLVPIFSGLLNKLVIVGGGIGFGLVYLGLNPILVVLSYLLVQIAAATRLILSDS